MDQVAVLVEPLEEETAVSAANDPSVKGLDRTFIVRFQQWKDFFVIRSEPN